jgi:hypothetical protein
MKKIILFSSFLLAFGVAVLAQEVTMTNTSSNPAYAAPSDITLKFRTAYPDVTNVTWNPMNTYWVASYNRNNRLMRTYYGTNGNSFNVSLPVLNGLVPEAVITSALSLFPNNLYDITRMKDADMLEIYQIRTIDNGLFNTIYIDQNGKTLTDVHTMQMNSSQDMNMQKDSKVKYDDGTKIKVEDNKTKIKNKDQ